VDSFRNFNEFFYRKLKPSARPVDSPQSDVRTLRLALCCRTSDRAQAVLVSAADCRCVVFESIDEATRVWVKGRRFSLAALLGDADAVRAAPRRVSLRLPPRG
jgi:phosphatidylserine decarboxylase